MALRGYCAYCSRILLMIHHFKYSTNYKRLISPVQSDKQFSLFMKKHLYDQMKHSYITPKFCLSSSEDKHGEKNFKILKLVTTFVHPLGAQTPSSLSTVGGSSTCPLHHCGFCISPETQHASAAGFLSVS